MFADWNLKNWNKYEVVFCWWFYKFKYYVLNSYLINFFNLLL